MMHLPKRVTGYFMQQQWNVRNLAEFNMTSTRITGDTSKGRSANILHQISIKIGTNILEGMLFRMI